MEPYGDSCVIPAQERRDDGAIALCKAFRDDRVLDERGVAEWVGHSPRRQDALRSEAGANPITCTLVADSHERWHCDCSFFHETASGIPPAQISSALA